MKIGADIGGSNLRVALVNNGKILKYSHIKTPNNKSSFLNAIVSEIKKIDESAVSGIGIGIPGPLKNGKLINPLHIPLHNFNLEKYLKNIFKKKVALENDANCVALAEARYGCKKKNFLIITFGTGIGGGIIINGKLYTGNGFAGEFGHINHKGVSLESAWIKQRGKPRSHEIIKLIAQSIGSLINIFDPDIIIFTGGIDKRSEFLKDIRESVSPYILSPRKVPIQFTQLKHAGILGASLLV